jgi:transposase
MGSPYSQDLRDRVLAAYDRGMASKQIAELFAVSRSWVRRVKQRRREHGQVAPRPMGGLRVVKIDLQQLKMLVEKTPDATIRELHQQLQKCTGIQCSESAVGMALGRLGFTFKKRRSMPPNRTGRTLKNAGLSGKAISRSRKPNA